MSSGREQVEVARWYTPALRIPKLIGKLPSGERIWGGPYRPVQLGTAVLTAALGVKTMGVWGHFHPLANYAVVIGAAYALGWLARYIPHGSTNPLAYISGSARVASRPTHGTWGRYAVTSAEPVRVRSQLAVHALPGAPETAACSRPVITAEPDPTPVLPQPASPAAVEDKLAALLAR